MLPRSCLVVRGPAPLPLVASEREGQGPWGCPRSLSSAGSHGTPAARGAASAVPRASSGSATRRRRARAGPFGVQRARQLFVGIRVLLIADGSSFGVRHVSPDRFAQRSGPRCGLTSSCSFALAHCESCTAPRGVAVELKASRHDSASISRCSKAAAVHESGRALVAEVQSCSKRQPPQCCHAKRDSCAVSASVGGVGRHLGSRHKCAPP